ncbi:uncharacterized protein [Ptychodera flava]|uniref:uncharacterized protein isoform X1 n=1 Tax=Ptychodera flava TaxID=63121 RepID=UPI00396A169F
MLTKNIDVSDGLVNGVFGIVSYIHVESRESFPSTIYVCFDNEKVGAKLRRHTETLSMIPEKSTPIKCEEDKVNNCGSIRRQFPLKLAWASTVHKVQGLTVDEAVVSLDKIFQPGQAYVALSRVKSLSGLTITDFQESAIYCNDKIDAALSCMPKFMTSSEGTYNADSSCTIMLHNIEGLHSHFEDLRNDHRFMTVDFICLTETWLPTSDMQNDLQLSGFALYHKPRELCYDTSDPVTSELKQQAHGGVGIYSSADQCIEILELCITNLEYLAFYVKEIRLTVAVIYRPKSYKADVFKRNLLKLVIEIEKIPGGNIIIGDFNENIFVSSCLLKLMEQRGFSQCVSEATTESGTLIDHVYVKNVDSVGVEVYKLILVFTMHFC